MWRAVYGPYPRSGIRPVLQHGSAGRPTIPPTSPARRDPVSFQIHHRGPTKFVPTDADPDGFQNSTVFNTRFRLDACRDDQGHWTFDLREKDNP